MKVLLDTHALLWFLAGDRRMSEMARELIESADNEVLVSIASLWEIAIKVSLGRLELKGTFEEVIPSELARNAIDVLPLKLQHVSRVATLEFHHRDPFDRIIAAQALADRLLLVTGDLAFQPYEVETVW